MCSPCIKSTQYPLAWKSFARKYFSLDGISNDYQIEIVPWFVVAHFLLLSPHMYVSNLSSVAVQFTHGICVCVRVCEWAWEIVLPLLSLAAEQWGGGEARAEMNIKYSRDFVPVLYYSCACVIASSWAVGRGVSEFSRMIFGVEFYVGLDLL